MSVITSTYERDALDWYVEPAWCVHKLIDAEPFSGIVYDPACGIGTIPNAFISRRIPAVGSDIVNRGPNEVLDFLDEESPKFGCVNVVCNPPFSRAVPFIETALDIATMKVAMILPLTFLASQARQPLFTETPVARVYVLSRRPSMPPGEKLNDPDFKSKGGSVDYCWIVWHHGHKGPPTMEWLI
ncbi:MAG: hypothetical protein ACPG4X_14580 [Pikeienuella sp.]